LAEEGGIDVVGGGPPCNTWSRARYVHWRPGPPPLRRRGEFAWGLPDLRRGALLRVREANTLLINFMMLCETVCRHDGKYFMEHPQDPGCFPLPSVWSTDLVCQWELRCHGRRLLLDQ
jgi:hypothetical protein